MSGPGGMVTKRDKRRETRRDQYQQRQAARQAERQRQLRQQQIKKYSLIGGGIILVLLLVLGISQLVAHGNSAQTGQSLKPATGQTVDGLQCLTQQGGGLHHHQYLDLYINGKQVTAQPGVGLVNSAGCLYPLHVHDGEPNIIHNESDQAGAKFTLGQFFDIWGMPLSKTQVGANKVDSTHSMVIKLVDNSGKVTTYTGDPRNLPLVDEQTIYILYNSPNVALKPYTDWANLGE